MSETLILAAIIAPLVLVPAIIVSFMSHVDGVHWPITEITLPTEAESRFAAFEREMIASLARGLGISVELLTAPHESYGSSWYVESLKIYRERGPWL